MADSFGGCSGVSKNGTLPQDIIANFNAGIPNIVGTAYDINSAPSDFGLGAFWVDNHRGAGCGYSDFDNPMLHFDAERGRAKWEQDTYGATPTNIIYGASRTVQPSAATVNYFIRAK